MTKQEKGRIIENIESIIERIKDTRTEIWQANIKTLADEYAYMSMGDACEHLRGVIRYLN